MRELSEREKQALRLTAQGYRYKEIAVMMRITTGTVCGYLSRARAKLRAANTANAIMIATQEQLF